MIEALQLEEEIFRAMGVGMPELVMDPPLEMRGLSKLVVLAGPNGAGKSRLLRLLPKIATRKLSASQIAALDEREEGLELERENSYRALEDLLNEPFPDQHPDLQGRRAQIEHYNRQLDEVRMQRRMSDVLTLASDSAPRFARFVPAGYQLVDPFDWSLSEAERRASQLVTSIDDSQGGAPAYLAKVFRRATEEGYQRFLRNDPKPSEAEESLRGLREILRSLLGQNVAVDVRDGRVEIGEIAPFTQALSPGQQVLVQFGCLLHAQVGHVRDAIVLMDEPENHLHPGVLISVIDTLRSYLADGQLWIATHSVPLIAHLMSDDPDCLWFVNEGRVKRAGRTPEIVLQSLLGGPEGTADLHALTLLPSSFAANRFLCECLSAPGVVGPDVKDPQTLQISSALWAQFELDERHAGKLRVLDFGAGKGRLLATLIDSLEAGQEPWFDYFAFDVGDEDKTDCLRQISSVYGDAEGRWFNDLNTLGARLDPGSFDAVVMCNVLHEVTPEDWPTTLPRCAGLLKPRGSLLIVEDYGIPIGERAHNYGFLLMDEPELVALFDIKEVDRLASRFMRTASAEERYRDRLVAHLIEKACVARVSAETQRTAIKKLRDRMEDEVQGYLRDPLGTSHKGRSYARSTQLLANASLWCKIHGQ